MKLVGFKLTNGNEIFLNPNQIFVLVEEKTKIYSQTVGILWEIEDGPETAVDKIEKAANADFSDEILTKLEETCADIQNHIDNSFEDDERERLATLRHGVHTCIMLVKEVMGPSRRAIFEKMIADDGDDGAYVHLGRP